MRLVLCVLMLALAGCSDGGDAGEGAATPTPTEDPAPSVNETLRAPLAKLNVTAVNGTAPLLVEFALDATGNWTSWTLKLGDGNATNGTDLPFAFNHTYGVGLWNATFQVIGAGGATNATATIDVAADATADVVVLEPFEMTLEMDVPCPGCKQGTIACAWRTHGNGAAQDCGWIDFPDELAGQPFTLTGTGLDPDGLFWESCDSGPGDRFSNDLTDESGTVPPGAGCILVWEAADPIVTVTFTITPA